MTAKEIFQDAMKAQKEIKLLNGRRAHYIEMATSLSGMSEVYIRSTEKRSRTEAAAIGLVEVADKLGEQGERYLAQVRNAEEIIARLEKPRHRQLLTLRYIEGLSWRSVSDEMGYKDPQSVYRVHGWALLAAEKILREK